MTMSLNSRVDQSDISTLAAIYVEVWVKMLAAEWMCTP